jgi:hypothetical protein
MSAFGAKRTLGDRGRTTAFEPKRTLLFRDESGADPTVTTTIFLNLTCNC